MSQPPPYQPPQPYGPGQPYGPAGGYPSAGGAYPPGGKGPYRQGGPGGGPGGYSAGPQPPPGPHPAEDLPLATVGRRAAARALETGLLWVGGVALIVPFALAIAGGRNPEGEGASTSSIYFTFFFVLAVIPFVYEWVQLAFRGGQTLGKAFFGLRVVTADPPGETISMFTAAKRAATNNVLYWAACGVGVPVGYLMGVFDQPLHQAVHDKLAGTVVIDEREYEESADDQQTSVYRPYTE